MQTNQKYKAVATAATKRGGWWVVVLMVWLCMAVPQRAEGFSLALDSIAAWGKFPRFCINTYRWGDKFFNSYDSLYVIGSGKRWNVKAISDTRTDGYNFIFDTRSHYRMQMLSPMNTTMGFRVTYMAVSAGYDWNVNKIFGGPPGVRKKFDFQFNCSLFGAQYYSISNDVGTTIHHMGPKGQMRPVHIKFHGIKTNIWGLELYYFFNHKHYSQAAAFNYSKIQVKSSGSPFVGLFLGGNDYDFDFHSLIEELSGKIPPSWDYRYRVKNKDYFIKFGYGYNWVFHRRWLASISEAPQMGIRKGYINTPGKSKVNFGLANRLRGSVVLNHKRRWFYGIILDWNLNVVYDKEHAFLANNFTVEVSAGYRFDLWK